MHGGPWSMASTTTSAICSISSRVFSISSLPGALRAFCGEKTFQPYCEVAQITQRDCKGSFFSLTKRLLDHRARCAIARFTCPLRSLRRSIFSRHERRLQDTAPDRLSPFSPVTPDCGPLANDGGRTIRTIGTESDQIRKTHATNLTVLQIVLGQGSLTVDHSGLPGGFGSGF